MAGEMERHPTAPGGCWRARAHGGRWRDEARRARGGIRGAAVDDRDPDHRARAPFTKLKTKESKVEESLAYLNGQVGRTAHKFGDEVMDANTDEMVYVLALQRRSAIEFLAQRTAEAYKADGHGCVCVLRALDARAGEHWAADALDGA